MVLILGTGAGGQAGAGVTDLLAFVIIVVVLFWRGSRIPGRGEIVERRLPEAPSLRHLVRTGLVCALGGAVLLIVFPFGFREALINTLIGALMALSLVVVTGFVGQISVVQLALAGAAAFGIAALIAGLLSAQALIPYALDKWFGLNGNWFLLVGGVRLIFTLLQNPEGWPATSTGARISDPRSGRRRFPRRSAPAEPVRPVRQSAATSPAARPCCG
jgi:hypothetical protein